MFIILVSENSCFGLLEIHLKDSKSDFMDVGYTSLINNRVSKPLGVMICWYYVYARRIINTFKKT